MVCKRCSKTIKETVKAYGHRGVWQITTLATREADGLKQKICRNCKRVLDEQILPMTDDSGKFACAEGLTMEDLGLICEEPDAWKMLTPVDLTVENETEYDLIAQKRFIVGKLVVRVEDGKVYAEIETIDGVEVTDAAIVLLADASEVNSFNKYNYFYTDVPAEIEIGKGFGDTGILVVMVGVEFDANVLDCDVFRADGEEHKTVVAALLDMVG